MEESRKSPAEAPSVTRGLVGYRYEVARDVRHVIIFMCVLPVLHAQYQVLYQRRTWVEWKSFGMW